MKTYISSILALFMFSNISMAGQYLLYIDSEAGDYIGAGREIIYTNSDLDFTVTQSTYDNSLHFSMNNFQRVGSNLYDWWGLDISAPFRAPLAVGVYEEARRWPFRQEHEPGLWFFGNGRGCNKIYGRFEVKEATYNNDGNVISFAVDFEQHCELPDRPPLYGSLRYNSDVPLPTLAPPRIILANDINSKLCVEAQNSGGSTLEFSVASAQENPSTTFIYEWSSNTGETGDGTSFSFDLGLNMNAVVTVTATDTASGESATTTRSVCVSDTTPPTITIASPQQGQTFVGNNLMLDVAIYDLVDKTISNYDLFIGSQSVIQLDPSTGVSKEKLSKPQSSESLAETDIIIKARDASGNEAQEKVEVLMRHDSSAH